MHSIREKRDGNKQEVTFCRAGRMPVTGTRGEKGVPPGERPVRFGEPRRVIGHLRRGGEGGADVGEVPEAAPEQVAGGDAPDRPVVAFHADAGGEREGLKKIVVFLFRIVPARVPCAMLSHV